MKRQYMQPAHRVINLDLTAMMATSQIGMTDTETDTEKFEVESRTNNTNLWDDEW